jgi:hypothetical protein
LAPISTKWSIMANHGWLTGLTCLSKPNPRRNVQLMTEVKWGVQVKISGLLLLNRSRIRGTLRYEKTASNTSKIHKYRMLCASFISTGRTTACGIKLFFYLLILNPSR